MAPDASSAGAAAASVPLVSVAMITYNHERYIRQALESALGQKGRFTLEVVVGDDCSRDGTGKILEELRQAHPSVLKVLSTEVNIGASNNFARVLRACRGDFVALLEGDDYWTFDEKIQRQLELLQAHPECAFCFHPSQVLDEATQTMAEAPFGPLHDRETYDLDDLFTHNNFIPTASVLLRGALVAALPAWYFALPIGDFPMHVLNAHHGRIGYLREPMCVYRRHGGGSYSAAARLQQLERALKMYQDLGEKLECQRRPSWRNGVAQLYADLCWELRDRRQNSPAFAAAGKALRTASLGRKLPMGAALLRVFLKRSWERASKSSPATA